MYLIRPTKLNDPVCGFFGGFSYVANEWKLRFVKIESNGNWLPGNQHFFTTGQESTALLLHIELG